MTEVAEASVETPEVPVSNQSYIGENGEFTEDWMGKAGVSEDLHSNQTLQTTKSVASMASQLVNAQKMIGKNPNMVVLPTEQSTEQEWSDFHKAAGRPDTPDEYQITHAEGMGEINAETETVFKNFAHSEGLRPSTVQKLAALDDQRVMALKQSIIDHKEQQKADCIEVLNKKWGGAMAERTALAERMINENASEENREQMLEAIGNSPAAADFLANIAKKFVEHKIISADVNTPTPNDALAAAETLRNTPGYINGELANTSPARYKQITQEISKLMEQAYPE